MFWPFKKRQPTSEQLADQTIEALTAIMAVAETYKGHSHIKDVLEDCEKDPSEAAVVWHALNLVVAMAASKDVLSQQPAEELYTKCLCALWDYYPTFLHRKLYPATPLLDYEFFRDTLFSAGWKKASIQLPYDFLMEIGAWNYLKSHDHLVGFVLGKTYERYCETFKDLQLRLNRSSW